METSNWTMSARWPRRSDEGAAGYVILAGPQCAGKTTTKRYLYARYMVTDPHSADDPYRQQNLVVLPEMRQAVMREHGIHSAIFIDAQTEIEIITRDLDRMDMISSMRGRVCLDETNIFTLAHARCRGLAISRMMESYVQRLHRLGAVVLFLDVLPEMSWARREPRYLERVDGFPTEQALCVLRQYRNYLFDIYDNLVALVAQLDVPVVRIDASKSVSDTLQACADAFVRQLDIRGVRLATRF